MSAALWVFVCLATLLVAPTLFIYIRMRGQARHVPVQDVSMDKQLPSLTLVIATYNEEQVIRRKLENVLTLDYPRDRLDIVVVDSASPDATVEIAEDFRRSHPELRMRVLVEEKRTDKAHALTTSLSALESDILCISDADAILASDSLRLGARHFADPNVGAVTGYVGPPPQQGAFGEHELAYRSVNSVLRQGESALGSVFIFNGPIAFFRRKAIDRFYPGADDTGTAMLVAKRGFTTRYEPRAEAYEVTPPTLRARFQQKTRRAVNILDTLFANSELWRSKKHPLLRRVYLQNYFLHVVSPTLFPLVALSGLISFVLLSFQAPWIMLGTVAVAMIVSSTSPGRKMARLCVVYAESQLILLAAMISILRGDRKVRWETIQELRIVPMEAPPVGRR